MIYWDHNATTPCAIEVIEAMRPFFDQSFANPASPHLAGRLAKSAVSEARNQVADLINCQPGELFFTSGATESNNLIFLALALDKCQKRKKIAVSAIEHKAILEPAQFLSDYGFQLVLLPVNGDGQVDVKAAADLIDEECAIISVQAANNETGVIQPVRILAEMAHSVGARFHTDAVQALGKIMVDVEDWDCDMASFSSHKVYGPKGIGALYIKGGLRQWPWPLPLKGGGQEGGLRPGTLNVPAIVGFGTACRLAAERLSAELKVLSNLTHYLESRLTLMFPDCLIYGKDVERLPGTSCISFAQAPGDFLNTSLSTQIAIGLGSACTSGSVARSHVISAMHANDDSRDIPIRISLGKDSSRQQIDTALDKIASFMAVATKQAQEG